MNDIEVSSIDLVEGGNVFKQGHYLTLGYVPRDEKGETVDLSGKTLNVSLWGRKGVVFEAAATYSGGVIRFTFDKLVAAGDYTVEFTATSSTDAKYRKKFPTNQHSGRIAIKQSADDLGVVGIQVYTVTQLKAEQKALLDAAVSGFTVDSETKMARVSGNTTYTSLPARLEADKQATALQLADKAQDSEVRKKSVPITLNDADSEFLAAVEGGGATSFNLLSIPRERSVNPNKTTFVKVGKNLLDKDAAQIGFTLASNGTLTVKADEFVSDFITVDANTQYTRVRANYRTAFYDVNQAFISATTTIPFTTPANCAFIRFSGLLSFKDSEQLEKGAVNTVFEEYEIDIAKAKVNKEVEAISLKTEAIDERLGKSEKGVRALKRNPIEPQIGEMWLYLPTIDLFVNGGFETGDLANWGTNDAGSVIRETGVSAAEGDYVDVDGKNGYKVSLTSHSGGTSSHTIYQVLRSTEGDLNKLSDFSLRFKPVSSETSEQNPEANSNAVFVRLQINAYDLASGGVIINDIANHRSNIYLFGATQYTNATHKQAIVEMDKWVTVTEDLRAFVTDRLTAGYTWGSVKRVEITAYTYAAASAGTNRIGVRFDSFMAVGE